MLIAMVSEHANPLAVLGGEDAGGQNVYVAALATTLARRGARVVVHTRRDGPGPRLVPLAPGVVVDHVPAGPAEPIGKDALLPYMDELADELARSWRRQRPDVVHAHFWMSGRAAMAAARPLGIPVVQTFHALGTVKRRMQGCQDTSPQERIAEESALAASVDHVVATSTDETFELARMGADLRRVSVVPCGVDLDVFSLEGPSFPRRPGLHRLVVVGRLVRRKGIADVVAALGHLPSTELVVAGGPAAHRLERDVEARQLAALARRMGVAERVRLVGRLDRSSVAALMRSSDALVTVPWYEPFGMVALEAMACGLPVIASNVGGLVDSVVDGATGLLVEPRSPDQLVRAVRLLMEDPARRQALGRSGRARAEHRYDWWTVAARVHEVYRRLTLRPEPVGGAVAR